MTDYAMKYDKKTMSEYIVHTMTGGTKGGIALILVCAALLVTIPVSALIMYFSTQMASMLIVVLAAVVMDIAVMAVLFFMVRTYSNKMLEAYSSFDGLVCSVSSERIIIARDGAPQTVTPWDKIEDAYDGRRAFYLKTDNDMLIILQKDNVLSGTAQETSEIITAKQKKG